MARAIVVVAFALLLDGAARGDEPPQPAEPAPQVEPAPANAASDATVPGAPTPPPTPAPLLMRPVQTVPSDGAAAPGGEAPGVPALPADPRFGDAGQVTINGALSASVGHLGYDMGNSSNTNVSVEPAFDYFAVPNFSQGASVFFRYSQGTSGNGVDVKSTALGLTGRVGQNFWLGDRVSFWPKLALGAWRYWYTYSAPAPGYTVTIDGVVLPIGSSTDIKEDAVFIEVQAPFLLHLARHFYVGFGPNAYADVIHSVGSASNHRRFVGASSTVGGWF